MITDKLYIYGKHALTEALRHAPGSVKKVYLEHKVNDPVLQQLLEKSGMPIMPFGRGRVPRDIEGSAAHQGVIGLISLSRLVVPYETFVNKRAINPATSLVLLGEIQDPHNVGAIIRSAAAFGISGVLIPENNQAPITGAVVKVSAGMTFRVPLVTIGNVNQTVRDLKKRGFWVYGLAAEGTRSLAREQFDTPTLFILGNEATGIREKTAELCDTLVSIPLHPQCESLNVAASAAVAFYAWSTRHPEVLALPKP